MKIIGINHSGYPENRNIISLPFKRYQVKKQVDLFKLFDHAYFKMLGKTNQVYHNSHFDLGLNHCDLLHFFNTVSFGKKDWITTFETYLPRFGGDPKRKYVQMGAAHMAKENCRKLIALSECTKRIQEDFTRQNFPGLFDAISEKTIVLHPAQRLMVNDYADKKLDEAITFTFIGSDFFRKGGKEALIAFEGLLKRKKNVKLNVVSDLHYGDSESLSTKKDQEEAMAIIQRYKENIVHYDLLPNNKILELLKSSHVAFRPTYADTYGYGVLEAQACGCPVISTDLRALPEINNNEIGWVIKVPKNDIGNGLLKTSGDKAHFSEVLLKGMEEILDSIVNDPGMIGRKGTQAIKHIDKNHNPDSVAATLERIYDGVLNTK